MPTDLRTRIFLKFLLEKISTCVLNFLIPLEIWVGRRCCEIYVGVVLHSILNISEFKKTAKITRIERKKSTKEERERKKSEKEEWERRTRKKSEKEERERRARKKSEKEERERRAKDGREVNIQILLIYLGKVKNNKKEARGSMDSFKCEWEVGEDLLTEDEIL
jgi:hypothetical protein